MILLECLGLELYSGYFISSVARIMVDRVQDKGFEGSELSFFWVRVKVI